MCFDRKGLVGVSFWRYAYMYNDGYTTRLLAENRRTPDPTNTPAAELKEWAHIGNYRSSSCWSTGLMIDRGVGLHNSLRAICADHIHTLLTPFWCHLCCAWLTWTQWLWLYLNKCICKDDLSKSLSAKCPLHNSSIIQSPVLIIDFVITWSSGGLIPPL